MVDERSVAVAKIGPSRFQGRGSSGSDIPDLAKSIKTNGLINPIHVWETEAGLELVCGARRLEAHRLLGRAEILAKVHSGIGTTEAASLHWSDNLEREDLGYYEQAVTAGRILGWADGAATVDRKAFLGMTGLSSARLKRLQQLHRLSPEVGAHVDSGALTQTEGIEISRLPQDDQIALAKEYLARIGAENPETPSRDLAFLKETVAARLPQKPKAEAETGMRVLADEIGAGGQAGSGESAGRQPPEPDAAAPPEGNGGGMPDDDAPSDAQREKKRPGTETVEYGECHDRIRLVMTPKDWIVTVKIPRDSSDSRPTQDINRAFQKSDDDRGGLHLLLAYVDAAGKMAREKGTDGQK